MFKADNGSAVTEKLVSDLKIEMCASSIIGTRKYQQDSYAIIDTDKGKLAVVCDGMGGLAGGERASALGISVLTEDFIRTPVTDARVFFREEAIKLDKLVYDLCDENENKLGAGTTIVSVFIKNDMTDWLSVGDSKIYIIRNNALYCVVREHNYRLILDDRLQKGELSQEEYIRESVQAEALISYLGMGELSLMDINNEHFRLYPGDVIILCSDGVYKTLNNDMILASVVDNYYDLQKAADTITECAMEYSAGSQDNTTVVLIRCS